MLTKEEIEQIVKDTLGQNKQDTEKLVADLLKPTVEQLTLHVGDLEKRLTTPPSFPLNRGDARGEATKAQDPANKPQDKAELALEARLKTLEAQLKKEQDLRAAQEKQASSLRFDSNLSSTLDEMKPIHKAMVQELLANRIKQDAVEKDGSWLTKDGKTIKEAITEFFGTDAGKHFLPSSHQDGAGTTESQPNRPSGTVDTVEALRQAFI